jgi:hypothetical protein
MTKNTGTRPRRGYPTPLVPPEAVTCPQTVRACWRRAAFTALHTFLVHFILPFALNTQLCLPFGVFCMLYVLLIPSPSIFQQYSISSVIWSNCGRGHPAQAMISINEAKGRRESKSAQTEMLLM